MFYSQNSFSSIITYILCQIRVELLKYFSTKFTKKHIECLPGRLDYVGVSSGSICLWKAKPEASIGSKGIEYQCPTFNIVEVESSTKHFSRKTTSE